METFLLEEDDTATEVMDVPVAPLEEPFRDIIGPCRMAMAVLQCVQIIFILYTEC